MSKQELLNEIARLQTKLDHFETEWSYLDRILLECGFRKGIMTLKKTVENMIYENGNSVDEVGF
ncbi:MAG: hypothetical protein FJZ62_04570 [Chlamydiae bacterium]|jgi:hypothetical protein|nr:hypothetical protein [Chlamydiota bacterium]